VAFQEFNEARENILIGVFADNHVGMAVSRGTREV
jgi:hypothetical protein